MKRRVGFTVTEMLVVIAIIGIMMALLLPAVGMVRETSRRTNCGNNLSQIGKAVADHNVAWQIFPNAGFYPGQGLPAPAPPPAAAPLGECNTPRAIGGNGDPQEAKFQSWGWAYQILPYLEREKEWRSPWTADGLGDQRVAGLIVASYFCPSRRRPEAKDGEYCGIARCKRGALDYAGNGGTTNRGQSRPAVQQFPADTSWMVISGRGANGTIIPQIDPDRVALGNIEDGASFTILVGERQYNRQRMADSTLRDENNGYIAGYSWDTIRWGYEIPAADGDDTTDYDTRFGSSHTSIAQFVMCDGAVKSINYSIDLPVFQGLCERNDGRTPPIP